TALAAPAKDLLADACRHVVWCLVLPHPDDDPASGAERRRVPCVTVPVSLELRTPILRVRLGLRAVCRTRVPEAAIDEHSDALTREDPVRTRRGPTVTDLAVQAEPETGAV